MSKTETSTTAVNSACLKSAQRSRRGVVRAQREIRCVMATTVRGDFDKIRGPLRRDVQISLSISDSCSTPVTRICTIFRRKLKPILYCIIK